MNGASKGSDLQELCKFNARDYYQDQVFMDNKTGDFWQVKKGKWELGGNVGLHWINALGQEADQVKKT